MASNVSRTASKRSCHVPRQSTRRESSRSEEHTSELQSQSNLVCRLLLEKKKPPPSLSLRPPTPPAALPLRAVPPSPSQLARPGSLPSTATHTTPPLTLVLASPPAIASSC